VRRTVHAAAEVGPANEGARLRTGITTFELSRCMGTSLGMIDRHYGHLAKDGGEHAIRLLDLFTGAEADVHAVDARGG
jgi:hypothetical protein